MQKLAAQKLALELMDQHLGPDHGVMFKFDRSKTALGLYRSRGRGADECEREIHLSLPLTLVNDEAVIRDTVLHEIAHALAGHKAGHGWQWKAMCLRVGAKPVRCASTEDVVKAPAKYEAPCPNCGRIISRHRLSKGRTSMKLSCGPCCHKYNGGRFSDKYSVVLGTPSRKDVV